MLVSPGKSSRLRELRERAMAMKQPAAVAEQPQSIGVEADKTMSPELLLARRVIDQRLAEIEAALPVGKQRRMFKIRYGVELEQIRDLPIKRIVGLLEIVHPQLNNPLGSMKRIAELNYNGAEPNNSLV